MPKAKPINPLKDMTFRELKKKVRRMVGHDKFYLDVVSDGSFQMVTCFYTGRGGFHYNWSGECDFFKGLKEEIADHK